MGVGEGRLYSEGREEKRKLGTFARIAGVGITASFCWDGLSFRLMPCSMKNGSVFFPPELVARARENVTRYPWAAEIKAAVVRRAAPWLDSTWDELWESVFGPGITRSWMVWSDGHCPSCRTSVTMYHWIVDPFRHPWKMRCPHCSGLFPKNDFEAFYRSGIDSTGLFRPERADRSLLINQDPDSDLDPTFGVDDGEGYVEGDKRWRFIGTYLIYGQWKQRILAGIDALSAAWIVTGDVDYARRAAILIDRVADVYPEFDFARQGLVYEKPPRSGYVSNWHDACAETRLLVEAYDRIRPAIDDAGLIAYLRDRAARHGLPNPKDSAAAIQDNIENRILRDVLAHRGKIWSNFPHEEQTCLYIEMVLGWPHERERLLGMLDAIIVLATSVDGVTGEKGLKGYATIGPRALMVILGHFDRIDPALFKDILRRHPRIRDHYRFHIDTRCLDGFYPQEGDGGGFGQDRTEYFDLIFNKKGALEPGLDPGPYNLLGRLYLETGDPAFAQVLYRGNARSVKDLPHDLFAQDPDSLQRAIGEAVQAHGEEPAVVSVNKPDWHLAILRSGKDDHARALWIDYDTGGRHCHADAMNVGLFACGLDLLPDFGYPPVQYGGWFSDQAEWYKSSAAHNTVVVDGRNSQEATGEVDLWLGEGTVQVVRASAPEAIGGGRYERTLALVEVGPDAAYVLDVFRVEGGSDHAFFQHSFAGSIRSEGLDLASVPAYGHGTQMRNFRGDASPEPGWMVEWRMNRELAGLGSDDVYLRFHGFTADAEVHLAESWVSAGFHENNRDFWIPQLLIRRQKEPPLESTFVGLAEPHRGTPAVEGVRRLSAVQGNGNRAGDGTVALEVCLRNGNRDLLLVNDPALRPQMVRVDEWDVSTDSEFLWIRRDADGRLLGEQNVDSP
jgi:hypothetical protein